MRSLCQDWGKWPFSVETNTKFKENENKQPQKPEQYVPNNNNKQDIIPETDLSEMEISDFPDKEFKIMVIEMLQKSGEQCIN